MIDFRTIPLDLPGHLYLHAMPGRNEPFSDFVESARIHTLDTVVCLTPLDEVRAFSPDYYRAITRKTAPFETIVHAVRDYHAPEDWQQYAELVQQLAGKLRNGESILLHCAAGIGRTGMTATAILLALGEPLDQAAERVRAAGSSPERRVQQSVLQWLEKGDATPTE